MIRLTSLRPAVNAVIPHLPKAAGRVLSCSLPYLPLAFELGKVVYKNRERIGIVVGKAATHSALGITDIASAAHYILKKVNSKIGIFTRKLSIKVKQKCYKTFNRYQYSCCPMFIEKLKQNCVKLV